MLIKIVGNITLLIFVARCNSTAAPEKVEVFVDDKPVYVEPGTTMLQVRLVPDNGMVLNLKFQWSELTLIH